MTLTVFLLFASLSLVALGGGSSIIPELQRQSVLVYTWLTPREFVDLYAITQVTPGPSMMIVVLVGYKAAGLAGALAAAVGMFGPSCLLTLWARHGWERLQRSRFAVVLQKGTPPLAVGTMLAAATLVARTADGNWICVVLTAAAAATIAFTRVGILPTMVVAAVVGAFFL